MPLKLNPFTAQFDLTGSGGGGGGGASYIDGEVQNFSALPQTVGSPAVDSAYLVREAEGTWLLGRKPAGIYIRTANTGTRASDWTYAGEFPDVFNDANFVLYDDADSTKNAKFQLSSIATGTTRTISVPDNDVTLPDQGTSTTDEVNFTKLSVTRTEDDSGQDSVAKLLSTQNTTISDANWRGRIMAGAENKTFLMGCYLGAAGIGAHTWTSAENESGAAWSDFLLNPDGGADVFIGCSGWDKNTAIVKVGNSDGKVTIADAAAPTKKFNFDVSGVTAGQTRSLSVPNASGTLALTTDAPASHTHGSITNDGKLGSTSGLPLVTTTAGAVTTLALGTAGQILRTKSDLSGVEFADPSGGGVTGAAASASDVLGVSGANITGVDAGSDKIVFWDDSASELTYLTVGSGLSLTDTTLTATATGGGTKTYAVFTALDNNPPATAFATIDQRNSTAVLDFDDTTDESAVFVGIMPEAASLGSGLKIRLHWMSTNQTSNNVVWDVSLERMTTDLDTDSFDTIASGTATANGTSGILTVTEITLTTIDSVTAGDAFRLKVTRDANNASDNMSNDAELVAVEVRSAA